MKILNIVSSVSKFLRGNPEKYETMPSVLGPIPAGTKITPLCNSPEVSKMFREFLNSHAKTSQ